MWVLNGAIPNLISMYIWNLVGGDKNQNIVYFLGVILLHRVTQTWALGEISDRIKDGTLAQSLLRPYSFMFEVFAKDIGQKANRLFTAVPLVIVLWLIINPVINLNLVYLLLAIPAVLLGYLVNFYLDSSFGLLTNWMGEAGGLARTLEVIKWLAAGFMIPFVFMPESIRNILNILPFRYLFSFPLELFMSQLSQKSITYGYLILGIWCLILMLLFKWLSTVSMKYFSAHGG